YRVAASAGGNPAACVQGSRCHRARADNSRRSWLRACIGETGGPGARLSRSGLIALQMTRFADQHPVLVLQVAVIACQGDRLQPQTLSLGVLALPVTDYRQILPNYRIARHDP